MKASDLVALCCARGVDFIGVAGSSNRTDGVAGTRRTVTIEIDEGVTDESRKRQRIEAPDTARGKGSRVARAPAYSHAELGIAAHGVKALAWSAAQHTIANDRTTLTLKVLHGGLMYHTQKYANQFGWEMLLPGEITRNPKTGKRVPGSKRDTVFYREKLCMLVLDEISFKPAFAKIAPLYAWYLGIEQATWDDIVLERFEMLKMRYAVWYGEGLRLIQRGINGPGHNGQCHDERPAA